MFVTTGVAAEPLRPSVGAIRWDAWTLGEITKQVEKTLGPEKYHFRLPWFAKVIDANTVCIDGSRQEIMDQEIDFAVAGGLDYWAFLLYQESSSMSDSIRKYLGSTKRNRIKFCVILHSTFSVPDAQWPRERDRALGLLKESGYMTVLDGRPLVYAFDMNKSPLAARRFEEFRKLVINAGLNPYYVYMGWNPATDFKSQKDNGFDAVSAYAFGSADDTYAKLCRAVETKFWQNAAAVQVPYVPLVSTGWDKQPRKDNPVSWEKGQAYHSQKVFPSTATPQEISLHLDKALRFVKQNRNICAANTVIIYAWNEFDEGGWLCPTWTPDGKPDTARLDAIGRILTHVKQP